MPANPDSKRHIDPDDPFNPEGWGEPEPSADDAQLNPPPVPPGDYLVKITAMTKPDLKVYANKNIRNMTLTLTVIEPKEFAGKHIRHVIGLFTQGEPDWSRRKRYQTLISMGEVAEGDTKGLVSFYWPNIMDRQYVYRAGLVSVEPEGGGLAREYNEAADFVGLYSEGKWADEEWVKPAPQEWEPRIRKSTSGTATSTDPGHVPDDI